MQIVAKGGIMEPLGELEASLAYLFQLQTKHTGGYLNPLVDRLRKALDQHKKTASPTSLNNLIDALTNALPVIENYSVDSYKIRRNMEAMVAELRQVQNDSPTKAHQYSFFRYSTTKIDLISWLSMRLGQNFLTLDAEKQVEAMIENKSEKEFRVKLKLYLHSNPEFLANIAMASPKAFLKLMSCSLAFHLEKYQIAKAIYYHGKTMIDSSLEPIEGVEKLVSYLNDKLFSLHSVEKLLEDPKAKAELDKSELFQLYQSEKYKDRQGYLGSEPNP